jgi:hypothetical protein
LLLTVCVAMRVNARGAVESREEKRAKEKEREER